MALAADMNNTISLIKNFWPDLHFDKADFVNGNPHFVVNFYAAFMAEIRDKMSYLLNEEIINEFDNIKDFEPEVTLYCNVARVLRNMKFVISLGDFYFPNPKKMYHCIKVCIHFVIFINNHLDEISNLLNENFKKFIEHENLKELKKQYIEENAELAKKYGEALTDYHKLKLEHEELRKEFQKMQDDKKAENKLISDMTTERNKLQVEIDNLEYRLKLLEDKESNLLENVITKEEYDHLISTEKYLQFELEKLEDTNKIDEKQEAENIQQFQHYAKILSNIVLDNLPVERLHEYKTQEKTKEDIHKQVVDDFNEMNNLIETERAVIQELEKKLKDAIILHDDLAEKVQNEENTMKRSIAFEAEKSVGYFQLIQQCKSDILKNEEDQQQLEADQHRLINEMSKQYERTLNVEKKATTNFHNMLKRFDKH